MRTLINTLWRLSPGAVKRFVKRSGAFWLVYRKVGSDYEPQVHNVIQQLVQPGWVCVDVGANIGKITRLLAAMVGPDGQVVAFEAHPDNTRRLSRNIEEFGYGRRVRIENLAVSDGVAERLMLFAGRGRSGAEWNLTGRDFNGNQAEPECEVAAVALDRYFPGQSRLDFVKIDVEGAGAQVLVGMRRLLREARPIVLLELHNNDEWTGREELAAANYKLYNLDGEQVTLSHEFLKVSHCVALPAERAATWPVTATKVSA